jgi:hypothetical protein
MTGRFLINRGKRLFFIVAAVLALRTGVPETDNGGLRTELFEIFARLKAKRGCKNVAAIGSL